jgi:large subunit ribosomal protein L25
METITLQVQSRSKDTSPKNLLKSDIIPVEFYGKGVKNQSFQVDYQTFRKIFKTAGTNTVINIEVDGGKEKHDVLIYDLQYNPVKDTITHVDLINVRMDQEIHAKIPLEFTGVALAVKDLGGTLTPLMNQIEVKCLPKDLVQKIQVSIEPLLTFHDFVRVKDLNVPKTMTILHNLEDVVITVSPPKQEEEETPKPVEGVEGAAVPAEGAAVPAEGAAPAAGQAPAKEGGKGAK